jgi:hypothetical protein
LDGAFDTQMKMPLSRRAELEYLLIHRWPRGQGFGYELVYDGDSGDAAHLSGLNDIEKLQYDAQRSGQITSGPGVVGTR